jgi:recombination protein RecR
MRNIDALQQAIHQISKLQGLGPRSARRIILHLMQNRKNLENLILSLQKANDEVSNCQFCGNLDVNSPCTICSDHRRNQQLICVVENIADLWAIERSQSFVGQYHVLGGLLSALDDVTPSKLKLEQLHTKITEKSVKEIVLAIGATLDGQTTAHYIQSMLSEYPELKISRLALGIPVGADLEYMDDGTIGVAMKLRNNY